MSRRRSRPTVELLEPRLPPATLVNPNTVTFQDIDGDNVTVKISKPVFQAATIETVFSFNTGFQNGDNTVGQQLQKIDLSILGASGASLTITAEPDTVNGGDGFVNVGFIDGTGRDLGPVTVDGDLGRIKAGDTQPLTAGLAKLAVQSLGVQGTATQGAGGDLVSTIKGSLGKVIVAGDVQGAFVDVSRAMKLLKIGGSLRADGIEPNSGCIKTGGQIATVKISGDLVGGDGEYSGAVLAGSGIRTVLLGGDLVGGGGSGSGSVTAAQGNLGLTISPVRIEGDLIGGAGEYSGSLHANGRWQRYNPYTYTPEGRFLGGHIARVIVSGTLQGGGGRFSGSILAEGGLDGVTAEEDVRGGGGFDSGTISCGTGNMGKVSISGDLVGGPGGRSGSIDAPGFIDYRNGAIRNGRIAAVVVFGSVTGGDGEYSGRINSEKDLGRVTVRVNLVGGVGQSSGVITGRNAIRVFVGGSLLGGDGLASARITVLAIKEKVVVSGSLIGGDGDLSGIVEVPALNKAIIGLNQTPGSGANSGQVFEL